MHTLNQKSGLDWRGLRLLIIVVLVMGVFFRLVNLDKKVYWYDEVYTSLRIAGYTRAEVFQQVSNGHVITIKELQKYQRPNSEKGLVDAVKSLGDDTHPPLYFVMARFWVQMFGSSVAVTRSLSAIVSLLVFPCLYWLCRELFDLPLVGWVAIALIAVSPFHVLYAQEARMYSLWTVTILLSSTALLRAMRLISKQSQGTSRDVATDVRAWGIYAATVALGLYTHFFSVLVVIAHGIYVFIIEGFRLSKTVAAFVLASLAGLLSFIPCILFVNTNLTQIQKETGWQTGKIALLSLVQTWIVNLSRVFFDMGIGARSSDLNTYLLPLIIPILLILILVVYSMYFLCRHTTRRVWLFIVTLIVVTALARVLPDLIFGGRRSSVGRYLIPCYLGIQLAVAYLLATQITAISVSKGSPKIWRIVAIALFSVGVLSCAISSQAETWWSKYYNYDTPHVARLINKTAQPLLISDNSDLGGLLSLSYLLDTKVRLQLVGLSNNVQIPSGFSDVFLIYSSKKIRHDLEKEQNYKIEPVYEPGELLRLAKY